MLEKVSVELAPNSPMTQGGHEPPIIIVGNGPVGVRAAQEILRQAPRQQVILYGKEAGAPYNRVRLSAWLAGDVDWTALVNVGDGRENSMLIRRDHCPVLSIDRQNRRIVDANGHSQAYAKLILATGSQAILPPIPGITLPGVFVFRDRADAERLMARRGSIHRLAVLGGGLLGLEAAYALRRWGAQVCVIERGDCLMPRNLDVQAAAYLRTHVLQQGIQVLLGQGVAEILGEASVQGVRLGNGETIPCDTLIVAVGVKPYVELAASAGLVVGQGVLVDDAMRSTDPDIYAIGECAEHNGQVQGLVAPGFEQATVAVEQILGGHALYQGAAPASRLKLLGLPVFSMGKFNENHSQKIIYKGASGIYRKLVLRQGRVIGGIAVGDWTGLSQMQTAITAEKRLGLWQRTYFRLKGEFSGAATGAAPVKEWSAQTIVCHCTGVSRGTLSQALAEGCTRIELLRQRTGASSVCGACIPLLNDFLGSGENVASPKRWALSAFAMLTCMLTLITFVVAPLSYADTAQKIWTLDLLWSQGLYKQISGYSLLALALFAALLGLRKRWKILRIGNFENWRNIHAFFGVLILFVIFVHTGFHLGENFNKAFMLLFLLLLAGGGIAGLVLAREAMLPQGSGALVRRSLAYVHIVLLWPLPILLGFHILSVYYF